MKILHCSDIHLGRRPVGGIGEFSNKRYNDYFKAFEFVIDKAMEESIDVMLVSGDLFDRKELVPEVLEKTEELLDRLKNHGISLLLIEGNHDNILFGKENESWIKYLENKGYLVRPGYSRDENGWKFNPVRIGNINFYGLGYPGGFINEAIREFSEYLKESSDNNNILLVHTAISSTDFLPGAVDKETIDLLRDRVIYIAGGHAHSHNVYPADNPYFFVPGSLEYWDFMEKEEKKGFIIFDTDRRGYEFNRSKPRRKISILIKSGSCNFTEFKEEFLKKINDYEFIPNEDIVCVEVRLEKSFFIDIVWCEEILSKKGALKPIIKIRYPYNNTEGQDNRMLSIEETEREIIRDWHSFSSNAEDTVTILQRLKESQVGKNYYTFFEQFDKLLDTMIDRDERE